MLTRPEPTDEPDTEATAAAQVLRRAAALVHAGWSRGAEARGQNGHPCDPSDPTAAEFSVVGAVERAADELIDLDDPAYWQIWRALLAACQLRLDPEPVDESDEIDRIAAALSQWNDDRLRTFEDASSALLVAAESIAPQSGEGDLTADPDIYEGPVAQLLAQAAVLVEDGWCQAARARTTRGDACPALDPAAVAFSAVGALEATSYDLSSSPDTILQAYEAMVALLGHSRQQPGNPIRPRLEILADDLDAWNDAATRNRDEVIDALRSAAAETDQAVSRQTISESGPAWERTPRHRQAAPESPRPLPLGRGHLTLAIAVGVILLVGLAAWQLAPLLIGSLWGTRIVLQADTSSVPDGERNKKLAEALEVVRRRVEAAGWLRPTIEADPGARILVYLPGVEDADSARRLLTRPAQMDFRERKGEQGEWVPATAVGYDRVEKPLTGRYFKRVELGFDRTQRPIILFEFNEEGTKLFGDITKRLGGTALKKELGIFLDGEPVSTPRVQEAITGGKGQITGSFTLDEAHELVRQLSAGPLPIPVAFVEAHTTTRQDMITGLRAAVNPTGADARR